MYSKRIVAYIDLLGFKNSVKKMNFDEVEKILDEFTKMINIADSHNASRLAHAHIAAKKYNKDMITFDENKQNLTFFSDCVVWSYPMDEIKVEFIHPLMSIISSFVILQLALYSKGILVRGGVTFGDLYQKGNKVFGDALITAYTLEQKTKYPRIAFDIEFLKLFDNKLLRLVQNEITFSCPGSCPGYFFIDLFKYVKFINQMLIRWDKDEQGKDIFKKMLQGYVDSICTAIAYGQHFTDPKIKEKYDWMKTKLKSIDNLQVSTHGL